MNKEKLINLSKPDSNISEYQSQSPKLYRAIKNLGDAQASLIDSVFPRTPLISFKETFILEGNPVVADDVLPYRYCVILPFDSNDNWIYEGINLTGCCIVAKIPGTTSILSVDIKVKSRGIIGFKSLFKPGKNPTLPIGTIYSTNVMFAINSLFNYDMLRIDILASDPVVSGISLNLLGNYVITEN